MIEVCNGRAQIGEGRGVRGGPRRSDTDQHGPERSMLVEDKILMGSARIRGLAGEVTVGSSGIHVG